MRLYGYNPPVMSDVYNAEKVKAFSVVSLFAGCGGSSTGYRMAGGNILAANEFMEPARKIYAKNYPHTFLFPEDIRKLTGEQILNKIGLKKGELDILDGSPPCAGFSSSGLKEKGWIKEKKYSSTVQRVDDLFYEFARILEEIQPKVFVAENVKGLTLGESKNILGGKSKSLKNFFDFDEATLLNGMSSTISDTLRKCGYKVSYKVFDASDYGVPQKRERLIFIGVRNDLGVLPSFPQPTTKDKKIIGKEALYDFLFNGAECHLKPGNKNYWYLKNHFGPHTSRAQIKKIKDTNKFKVFEQVYNRNSWNKYALTLLQSDFGNVFHPVVDRFLSVEEARRIQTFPDDYNILTPKKNRVMVSLEDLENPTRLSKFGEYSNFDCAENSGNIKQICEIAGLDYSELYTEKIFVLDFNTDEKTSPVKPSGAFEFFGRAVPPLFMKAIASHVYENILKKV